MTQDEFIALVKAANDRFNALTPEQQQAYRNAQRDSWVRGEMALSALVKKHRDPKTGAIVYDDYASYCFD